VSTIDNNAPSNALAMYGIIAVMELEGFTNSIMNKIKILLSELQSLAFFSSLPSTMKVKTSYP
jgi:hypothetical protein